MLNTSKSNRTIIYSVAGLVGLCSVLSLIFVFSNAGNVPPHQAQQQLDHQQSLVSQSDDEQALLEYQHDQANYSASQTTNINTVKCTKKCFSALSMLNKDLTLDDETFHKLGAYTKEIAAHLQNNEGKRLHYLEMALTTNDADKRQFLTDIFGQLPYQQKAELGDSLIASQDWQLRADGVTLIANEANADLTAANTLMEVFSSEENSYVKNSILGHLEQSSTLKGDTEILQQLDAVIYSESDPSVRVAGLKAKMQLSEQPYHILPDALQALRASEPELQLAGLIAIEQVLEHEKAYVEDGAYIDRNSFENEFKIIRDMAVYGDDKQRFDYLIREANLVYSRHFKQ